MWHALRAELAYARPWLLGGLAIAAGVAVILSVIFSLLGDDGPPSFVAATLRGFFPLIAALSVGFIAQGQRSEEHRSRLLMAGPLTPRMLAAAMVLLPALLFAIGALVTALVVGAEALLTGVLCVETLRALSGVAGVLFAIGQLGPLAQEATAAHRQRRLRASTAGWSIFVLAVLILTTCQLTLQSLQGHIAQPVVALVAMATSVLLCTGRTDFSR
jgi:hypothetical protein